MNPMHPYAQPMAPQAMPHGYAGYPAHAQVAQAPDYEFQAHEEAVIATAGGRTRLWGIVSIVVGALQCCIGVLAFKHPSLLGTFVSGVISIVVGVVFLGAGKSLGAIADTRGNDVRNLMTAMQRLTSAFTIQTVVAILGTIATILIFFLAVVVAMTK
jgi:hypothetical protein